MIDILVVAWPDDQERAGVLVDALVSTGVAGPYRTRFMVALPDDAIAWPEILQASATTPCVVFCWSKHTTTPRAKPLRSLAAEVLEAGRAISVELDARSRPSALKDSTTYPLYGWRAQPRWWHTFIFGKEFVTQIAAGAKEKVIGRDPPPPSAYWRMVRAQAWAVLIAAGAVFGGSDAALALLDRFAAAKWRSPAIGAAFDAAVASPQPCDAVRAFVAKHPRSAWANDAAERLATCTLRSVTVNVQTMQPLEVFGATLADAQRDGEAKCRTRAQLTGARLISVRIDPFVANVRATALCELEEPSLQTVETMGAAAK